ncbi:MAG: hypothetical protein R3D67_00585 [Hyphomicrobiaceae bacterium]
MTQREADADRLSQELQKAHAARQAAKHANEVGQDRATLSYQRPDAARHEQAAIRNDQARGSDTQSADDEGQRQAVTSTATRVTVLLHMEPGNYGIRRNNKSADPLLCREWDCYVSGGADTDARAMHRRRAFGIGRTLGSRAGACSNSLGCVFRGIDLGSYPAVLQPVDMHVLRHDKREPTVLRETSACRIVGGALECQHAFQGPGYVMWVVPETLAERAGSGALQAAVDRGLAPPPNMAATPATYRMTR